VERHEAERVERATAHLDVGEGGGLVADPDVDLTELVRHEGGDLLDVVVGAVVGGHVHPVAQWLDQRGELGGEVVAGLADRDRIRLLLLDQGGELVGVGLAPERVERQHPEGSPAHGVGVGQHAGQHHPPADQEHGQHPRDERPHPALEHHHQ
jgi:hypothetical protein